ncbi:hypothetical protein BSKO_00037 [Bryopsis sp. KO-2023]|nr:hypothetical protein BSKO_00037 [Bryopsis sp. KO-2023]
MSSEIVCRAHARSGLLGNPSDQYEGKTISIGVGNFYAEVKVIPSEKLCFLSHPIHDRVEFDSMEALGSEIQQLGYYGGVRLLKAICKKFLEYCSSGNIRLERKNFTMSYETNIPRQLGLGGSSAIITAGLNCLLQFYSVKTTIPFSARPGLILSAESDLGITAGLQDRVIQVYGGCVFMDFSKDHMESLGRGRYTSLAVDGLPSLWLMLSRESKDSGEIHKGTKEKWLAGDSRIIEGMQQIAELAEKGREALEKKDFEAVGRLMDENFYLRRRLYGDAVVGEMTVKMVEMAKSVGAHANNAGSGGAVVVLCSGGDLQILSLTDLCRKEGFRFVAIEIGPKIYSVSD